jgi:tetratricopeptide (TPR) repeat protein
MAYCLAKLGKYDESLDSFYKSALAPTPRKTFSTLIWSDIGDAQLDHEKCADSALEAYEKSIELYPELIEDVRRSQFGRINEDALYKISAKAHKGKGDAHYVKAIQAETGIF